MSSILPFGEVLEAVDGLSTDEQETLLTIVQRRMTERARQQLLADTQAARAEFEQGLCKKVSVEELMAEILS